MRRVLVWVVLAAVAPVAGCGSDESESGSDPTLDRLIASMEKVQETPTRARLTMRADTEEDGRFRMTGTVEAQGLRGTVDARFVFGGQAIDAEMIMHERVFWMRSPQLMRLLPPGKQWIRTTDPELVGGATVSPDMLAQMLEAAGEVERIGRERVSGEPATRLRATLDLRRLAELDTSDRAGAFLQRGGAEPMPIEVWIGSDGRPLRYRVEVRMPRAGGGRQQFAVVDVQVLAYDIEVDTDPPPSRLVTGDSVLQ